MDELAERLRQANSMMEVVNVIITRAVPRLELRGISMVFLSVTGAPIVEISGGGGPESLSVQVPLRGVGTIVGILQFWTATIASEAVRTLMDDVAMLVSLRLAEIGVTRRVHAPRLATLTPRQAEIARLVARGESNQEVAEQLGITINTVKKSLKLVFHSLGANNRTELVSLLDRSAPLLGPFDLPDGYHAVVLDDR